MTEEKRLLAEWLRSHNYALCTDWKITSVEPANELLDGAVSSNTDWGSVVKCKVEVTLYGKTHNLDIAFEGGVSLLDSYKYFLAGNDFMVLVSFEDNILYLYKQNPVW